MKYIVMVDFSPGARGYVRPVKHIVEAKNERDAATKVIVKEEGKEYRDAFKDSGIHDEEYYIDGDCDINVYPLNKPKKKKDTFGGVF